jgi:hypothetical protein
MRVKLGIFVAILGLFAVALPVFAHHSFAAEYDNNQPVTLKGTIAKIEWMNPHIWMYIDAKDAQGKVTRWQCEGGPPNSLTRQGWTKNALKAGDEVTMEGFRAKDATNTCNARSVKLPGGKSVFAGSAEDGGPSGRAKEN